MILGFLLQPRLRAAGAATVLLIGLAIMTAGAVLRSTEYDETYTVLLAAGTPRPDWPAAPFTAGSARHFFAGNSTAVGIARDLRETDVHPPLYFWAVAAWRGLFGTSLLVTRLASVTFSLGALLCVGVLASRTGVPPVAAMLLTLGCYGFASTGLVARGFALAQLLSLAGCCLLVVAERRGGAWVLALAGGALLGLASFTNYLAAFVAGAGLLWLLLRQSPGIGLWLAGVLGFAAFLPADLYFFVGQRGSRLGQFPPFNLPEASGRLAEYSLGAVFGGLPLYVTGVLHPVVGGLLWLAFAVIAGVIAWRWRVIGVPGAPTLFAFGLAAMPAGLLLLGIVFDNTPIELRYLAFATPFCGLAAAGAIGSLGDRPGMQALLLGSLLAIQAASLAGMVTRPETMQPQRAVARAASQAAAEGSPTLVLLPRGNDGVGVVGAFISEAPDDLHLLVFDQADTAPGIRDRTAGFARLVVAQLGLDRDSKADLARLRAILAADTGWRPVRADALVSVYDRAGGAQAESGQR